MLQRPMAIPTGDRLRRWLWAVWFLLAFGTVAYADPAYPLHLSANNRYLVDDSGTPFLINGDTPWSLFVKLTKTEADTYLEDRRQKGFNAVIANLIERGFGGPEDRDGDLPFASTDSLVGPNEAYFAHADWVIQKAAEKGMLMILTPAYLGYACGSQGWCQQMKNTSLADLRAYGAFLGNRYKNYTNIIWLHGGDTDASDYGVEDRVNAIVEGIESVDSGKLATAHCNRQYSAIMCYDYPWLDINTTYSDCTSSALRTRNDYQRNPVIPFFFIEGTYEGEGADGTCLRSQAYWSVLGGSTGHFFGNNPIWLFDSGWQQALNSSGAQDMTRFRNLFASRPWYNLVPDYAANVVTTNRGSIGSTGYVAAASAPDGSGLVAYLPDRRSVAVDLTAIGGTSANAWWFNPRTGDATFIGEFETTGSTAFDPPSSGDWVLVIDNSDLNLPAPGSGTTAPQRRPNPPENLIAE